MEKSTIELLALLAFALIGFGMTLAFAYFIEKKDKEE